LLGLAVAGGLGYLAICFGPGLTLSALGEVATEWLSPLKPAWEAIVVLANATLLLVQAGGQLLWWISLAVVAMIYLTSVGLGTVCYRMALNKI
jgi:hypothetical protein